MLRRTIQFSRERGHQLLLGIHLAYIGYGYANRGDISCTRQPLEESIQILEVPGVRHFLGMTYVFYGLSHIYAGNQPDAENAARNALAISRGINDIWREGEALVCLGHALAAQDRLDEADEAYTQGLALYVKMERTRRSLEALAGLAMVTERQGDTARALAHIEKILQDLAANQAVATEESFRVYRTCYQLLHQHQDPRAPDLLNLAYEQLQKRSASLTDSAQQQLFWDMPGHREIELAWRILHTA